MKHTALIVIFLLTIVLLTGCGIGLHESYEVLHPQKSERIEPLEVRTYNTLHGAVDGDRLVYSDDNGLTVVDLMSGEILASIKTVNQRGFDISGNIVVWSDLRNDRTPPEQEGGLEKRNADVFMRDLVTGETIPIATTKYKEGSPKVSGNRVTWEAYNGSFKGDIFVYDLESSKRYQINNRKTHEGDVVIHGNMLSWLDERNGIASHDIGGAPINSDIYLYDLETGTEIVASGDGPQVLPAISDRWIVFGDVSDREPKLTAVRYR